jgi:hypothetical protein
MQRVGRPVRGEAGEVIVATTDLGLIECTSKQSARAECGARRRRQRLGLSRVGGSERGGAQDGEEDDETGEEDQADVGGDRLRGGRVRRAGRLRARGRRRRRAAVTQLVGVEMAVTQQGALGGLVGDVALGQVVDGEAR